MRARLLDETGEGCRVSKAVKRHEFPGGRQTEKEEPEMAGKRKVKKASGKRVQKKAAKAVKKVKAKRARKKAAVRQRVRSGQISASEKAGTVLFDRKGLGAGSGGQSGDLQGVSDTEGAASESVEELLEEGNSFEAEVVAGVERAGDADEKEVRAHEVNEDDVPEEYLERDR